MKTVAYLIRSGRDTFTIAEPNVGWQGLVPKAHTSYGAVVCVSGLAEETEQDEIRFAQVVKVSRLSRKRPGCVTLRRKLDVLEYPYVVIGDGTESLYTSTKVHVLDTLLPEGGPKVVHLKFTVLD